MTQIKKHQHHQGSRLVIREDEEEATRIVEGKTVVATTMSTVILLWLTPNNRPKGFHNSKEFTLTSRTAKWVYKQLLRLLIVANRWLTRLQIWLKIDLIINRDSLSNANSSLTEQYRLNYWNLVAKLHRLAIRARRKQIKDRLETVARDSTSLMKIESLKTIIYSNSIKLNHRVRPPLYCPPNKAKLRR